MVRRAGRSAHRKLAGDRAGAEPRRTRRHSGSLVLHVSWLCVGGLLVTCTAGGTSETHPRQHLHAGGVLGRLCVTCLVEALVEIVGEAGGLVKRARVVPLVQHPGDQPWVAYLQHLVSPCCPGSALQCR